MRRAVLGAVALLGACGAGEVAHAQCGAASYYARQRSAAVAESLLTNPGRLARRAADPDLVIMAVERQATGYDSVRIPGARLLLLRDFVVDRDSLITELPPVERLVEVLAARGVTDRSRIVLYGDLLAAARLWFTLDYLGLGERTALLDGGLAAWRAEGLPLERGRPGPVAPGGFTPTVRPDVLIGAAEIRNRSGDESLRIVDARAPEEYRGDVAEVGVSRNGHIPGATNLDWTTLLEDGWFRRPSSLRAQLLAAGVGEGKELIAVCRVGTRASVLYFAGRYLGVPTRLYDGSMNDWSRRGLPIATGPGPR
ncbi:MAG: sulfurtransferase [Gemmatimonadetes bacterium]|nr:sulfurtransferase [Gemmatimonadota bacterium]